MTGPSTSIVPPSPVRHSTSSSFGSRASEGEHMPDSPRFVRSDATGSHAGSKEAEFVALRHAAAVVLSLDHPSLDTPAKQAGLLNVLDRMGHIPEGRAPILALLNGGLERPGALHSAAMQLRAMSVGGEAPGSRGTMGSGESAQPHRELAPVFQMQSQADPRFHLFPPMTHVEKFINLFIHDPSMTPSKALIFGKENKFSNPSHSLTQTLERLTCGTPPEFKKRILPTLLQYAQAAAQNTRHPSEADLRADVRRKSGDVPYNFRAVHELAIAGSRLLRAQPARNPETPTFDELRNWVDPDFLSLVDVLLYAPAGYRKEIDPQEIRRVRALDSMPPDQRVTYPRDGSLADWIELQSITDVGMDHASWPLGAHTGLTGSGASADSHPIGVASDESIAGQSVGQKRSRDLEQNIEPSEKRMNIEKRTVDLIGVESSVLNAPIETSPLPANEEKVQPLPQAVAVSTSELAVSEADHLEIRNDRP